MENQLKEMLWKYVLENNPELMFSLQDNYAVGHYLDNKVASIKKEIEDWTEKGYPKGVIEILSLELLTKDLKPSRFHYIKQLLQKDFYTHYLVFQEKGTLTYEVIALIELCAEAFDAIKFSNTSQNSPRLYKVIKLITDKYLSKE